MKLRKGLSLSLKHNKNLILVIVVIFSTVASSMIRKIIPSQPNLVEQGINAFTLLIVILFALAKGILKKERWFYEPLILLVFILMLYDLLAFFEDPIIGVLSFLFRINPIIFSIIVFSVIRNLDDVNTLVDYFVLFVLIIFPFGIIGATLGNDYLPIFLQQIKELQDRGKAFRHGVRNISLVFNSASTFGIATFSIFSFLLSKLTVNKKKNILWVVSVLCLILVFLSTRRGVFYFSTLMIIYFLYQNKLIHKAIFIGLFTIPIFLFSIDKDTSVDDYSIYDPQSREALLTDVDFSERFNEIFLDFTMTWLKRHFWGTYLGYAGREASVIGTSNRALGVVEVGGASLAAEMGIIGLVMYPVIVIWIWRRVLKRSKGLKVAPVIKILALYSILFFIMFYTKEAGALTIINMAMLLFWTSIGIAGGLVQNEINYKRSLIGKL